MMKSFKFIFLGFVLASSLTLGAQQTGEIRGKVADEKGEALPGVAVTARSLSLQGIRTAVADKNGDFRFPLLPVGKYSLTCELAGFEKLTLDGYEIQLGFTTSVSIVLKPSKVEEQVIVTAVAPLIDKTKTDNSYRLNSDELARVPAQARTIAEVVGFTPGVTGTRANTVTGGANVKTAIAFSAVTETGLPNFRGEGDAGNNWLVDGLSTKGPVNNDPGVRINYDAWEEVQIVSDGFAPNMGQGLGGFINIVTKSGGNSFHGEFGTLVRSRYLRAQRQDQLSVASIPDTSLSHLWGNLGGPVLKDKLWFFISNNFYGTRDESSEQSIDWLTIPAGSSRIGTNNVFGKLTFTPYQNHTFSLSGTLDKFLNQSGGIGVPETYAKTEYTDYFYRLNYRGILSQNTLLTGAVGRNHRKKLTAPISGNYGPPSYYWQDIGQWTNNCIYASDNTEWRTDLNIGLTHYLDLGRWGSHEVKAGASYYANEWDMNFMATGRDADPWPGNGFDNGISITWAGPGIPLSLGEQGPGVIKDSTRGLGLYVEDNITLGRFSFMLGMRADTQKVFNDAGVNVWSWGMGDFLQPRVSLAVDLSGDGHNVLKFGYGRFAMPMAVSYLTWVNQNMSFSGRQYAWVGPESPTDSQLEDPANWLFFWEQSTANTPIEVDPGLKPNKSSKFLLEFDRQLGINWALKIRGVYSYSRHLMEDIALYDPETSWVKYLFTNFELKKRDYRALEIELDGKVSGRFMLNASYTWSRAKGTNPGNSFESVTWDIYNGSLYDGGVFGDRPYVPDGSPNKELLDSLLYGLGGRGIGDEGWYGPLPYSIDHVVKILGTYLAPHGVAISSNIEYLSGYHWEKKGWSEGYGAFWTFPEGRGSRTTPAHLYIDLSVEKDFALKKGMILGVGVNAYNLLNSQRPIALVKQDNELFGQVWARQLPRWVQLKFSLKF